MAKMNGLAKLHAVFHNQAVLVTGGMGFIGGHLTAELARHGAKVTVLDRSIDAKRESLLNLEGRPTSERIEKVEGDIADAALVRKLIAHGNYRYVFNFASGATVIEQAVVDPVKTVESNTTALVNLLEAVRRAPFPPQVLFQASTDKVYGDGDGRPYDEDRTPLRSLGIYDCSKLAADVLTRSWFSVFGVPTVVLRLCNIFGPGDFNTGFRIVPRAMRALFSGDHPQAPELYFDSIRHERDYLFIDDCVTAILLLVTCPRAYGQAFNLPGCCHLSTPEMCRTIIDVAAQVEQQFDPARAQLIRKNGVVLKLSGQQRQVATIQVQHSTGAKLRQTTGFAFRCALRDGLARTVRAYRDYYCRHAAHHLAPDDVSTPRSDLILRTAG